MTMADSRPVNPWTWQDRLGFSQALDVRGAGRVLYCSGQTSVDGDGKPLHAGDMAKQIGTALDNLEHVLKQAGLGLGNVVRLNYYTTDIAAFAKAGAAFGPRLAAAACKPASTLLGVARLFHPDLMIEIEATAVE
jgi:enamine deaminase RidA (YjgF/YER057c/UK114 family)